jgi:hypothetical protein
MKFLGLSVFVLTLLIISVIIVGVLSFLFSYKLYTHYYMPLWVGNLICKIPWAGPWFANNKCGEKFLADSIAGARLNLVSDRPDHGVRVTKARVHGSKCMINEPSCNPWRFVPELSLDDDTEKGSEVDLIHRKTSEQANKFRSLQYPERKIVFDKLVKNNRHDPSSMSQVYAKHGELKDKIAKMFGDKVHTNFNKPNMSG